MKHGACTFSGDRLYRYDLWRVWGDPGAYAMFIGLNPSTADETSDDPTVRRCIGFAKKWGFGALCMTNAFAFRSTDPEVMKAQPNPVGPDNNQHLRKLSERAGIIVAAWGNHGAFMNRSRSLMALLCDRELMCFGLTKIREPLHPLYQSKDAKTKSAWVLWAEQGIAMSEITIATKRPVVSPSNLHRAQACPGSKFLIQELQAEDGLDAVDATNESREEGVLLHRLAALRWSVAPEEFEKNPEYMALESDAKWVLDFMFDTENRLVREILGAGEDSPVTVLNEVPVRWGLEHWGTIDLLAYNNRGAIVLDRKTGRLPVSSAETNLQIRGYVVPVHTKFGSSRIHGVVLQPRAPAGERIVGALYEDQDFSAAEAEINAIRNSKDHSLHASPESCRYCPVKSRCSAAIAMVTSLANHRILWSSQTPERKSEMLGLVKMAEVVGEDIRRLAAEDLKKNPEAIPGYRLNPGRKSTKVLNPQKAFEATQDVLSQSEFAGVINVLWAKWRDAWVDKKQAQLRESGEKVSKDALKAAFVCNMTSGGIAVESQGEPFVEPVFAKGAKKTDATKLDAAKTT